MSRYMIRFNDFLNFVHYLLFWAEYVSIARSVSILGRKVEMQVLRWAC